MSGIANVANIPEIKAQSEIIEKILHTDHINDCGINEFEEIREKLRALMKYIPSKSFRYDTNFTDGILSTEWKEAELDNDDLKNYKARYADLRRTFGNDNKKYYLHYITNGYKEHRDAR